MMKSSRLLVEEGQIYVFAVIEVTFGAEMEWSSKVLAEVIVGVGTGTWLKVRLATKVGVEGRKVGSF